MPNKVSPCMTPKKSKIYAPASPVYMKKSPCKRQDSSQLSRSSKKLVPSDRSRKKSSTKAPINVANKLKNQENYQQ